MADSLIAIYNSSEFNGNELALLREILVDETNPEKIIIFADLLINMAAKDSLFLDLRDGYMQKGYALRLLGDYPESLESYFESMRFAEKSIKKQGVGEIYISIADVYSIMGNSITAENYYGRGIELLREADYPPSLASALLNAGDNAFKVDKFDLALTYFKESTDIFGEVDYPLGKGYGLGNVGMVYAAQGKDDLAEQNMNEAIEILEELQDYPPISEYLIAISEIYQKKEDWQTSIEYAKRSLDLATQYGLKDEISDANLKLSELYEKVGEQALALNYFKSHIAYRDSVKNIEAVQQMADTRTDFEVAQKQLEVDLQKKNQRIIVIATSITILFIALLAIAQYRRFRFVRATNKIIEEEKQRSDNLLLNILPEETAEELKANGKVRAKKYESATVLFTDFAGFTSYSKDLSPEVLVETVSHYFSKFDEIMEKYGLEKIKTIGDSYMCAGGLPFVTKDHAHKMLCAAFEIARFTEETKQDLNTREMSFDIRIGISSGPVVAGVVGSKKFAFDIWGDTVNIAARMESNAEPGKINISESTYNLVKDSFKCSYRGEIEVKNRGILKMYYADSIIDGVTFKQFEEGNSVMS
ncbi:adenylate/guanylate cyclase domain-containing protein [Roseivirga sp.]|uniref:adenylate/guanylate cyclase domain-containing protein n=1 Tax=Roseivirga sp. TaxID=1964215 RepID=UPI002B26F505|nr:adenylate/guanylate cyclase domain-containing protein [Roseivirga sp.]